MATEKRTKERIWMLAAGTHAALLAAILLARTFFGA